MKDFEFFHFTRLTRLLQTTALKPFVSIRVSEIQSNSDPATWRHLPGEYNVADEVSPGIPAQSLTERWQRGPEFLRLHEHEWPADSSTVENGEVEQEIRKSQKLCTVKETTASPIDCTRFSSWRRLVRVTAYVFRFYRNLKARVKKRKAEKPDNQRNSCLSVKELEESETYWIKQNQKNPNAVRGSWTIDKVINVFPGKDGKVRNMRVKTCSGEYERPVSRIAVIYPEEGYKEN